MLTKDGSGGGGNTRSDGLCHKGQKNIFYFLLRIHRFLILDELQSSPFQSTCVKQIKINSCFPTLKTCKKNLGLQIRALNPCFLGYSRMDRKEKRFLAFLLPHAANSALLYSSQSIPQSRKIFCYIRHIHKGTYVHNFSPHNSRQHHYGGRDHRHAVGQHC